ncbi:MAG: YkgJ family cysteine cluster protein [Candidatus Hermodarchaeota archaeon]
MSYIKNKVRNLYWGEFNCEMCGECCRSGYDVYVNKEDVKIWKKLNKQFLLKYVIVNPKSISETKVSVLTSKDYNIKLQSSEDKPVLTPKSFNVILKGSDIGLEYIIEADISDKCPFLYLNRCLIHNFKPIGCYLFPYNKDNCFSRKVCLE